MDDRRHHNDDDDDGDKKNSPFPAGYRFMPTDQELVLEYLARKVNNRRIPVAEIYDVKLYNSTPFQLSEEYPPLGEKEWYFFTPRDRKYPKGSRPKRSVGEEGYWKATGADKKIRWKGQLVGKKNVLVFYLGKPKSKEEKKTNWIMHEYMLNTPSNSPAIGMRLDDWVLCRIYEKMERMLIRKPKDVEDEDDIIPPVPLDIVPVNQAPVDVVPLEDNNRNESFGDIDHINLQEFDNIVLSGCQNHDHKLLMTDPQLLIKYSNQLCPDSMELVGGVYGQNNLDYHGMPHEEQLFDQLPPLQDLQGGFGQLPDFDWSNMGSPNQSVLQNDSSKVNDSFSIDDFLKADEGTAKEDAGKQDGQD